jgi:hypothetical protein
MRRSRPFATWTPNVKADAPQIPSGQPHLDIEARHAPPHLPAIAARDQDLVGLVDHKESRPAALS